MATLTAWKFDSPHEAERAVSIMKGLQEQALIQVIDAAWVEWPPDKKGPKTHQLHGTQGTGALSGGFWGLLFGLIFFVPLIGLAVGAAMGALSGSLVDVGIDDEFIKRVRSEVTPGTSALFVMSQNAVIDKVHDAFGGFKAHLVATNLSHEEETKLQEVFAE